MQPPIDKLPLLSRQHHSKNWNPVKHPLFENLVGGSTPPSLEKGGGGVRRGAHYDNSMLEKKTYLEESEALFER